MLAAENLKQISDVKQVRLELISCKKKYSIHLQHHQCAGRLLSMHLGDPNICIGLLVY